MKISILNYTYEIGIQKFFLKAYNFREFQEKKFFLQFQITNYQLDSNDIDFLLQNFNKVNDEGETKEDEGNIFLIVILKKKISHLSLI